MSESDEDDIPDIQTCDRLCKDFASITKTDTALAQFYLQDRKWELERSVNDFFEDRLEGTKVKTLNSGNPNEVEVLLMVDGSQESLVAAATAILRESSVEKPSTSMETLANKEGKSSFPEIFKFITWNIDGLDEKNLKIRTKAVADYVKEVQADVIFFQEVIPQTQDYLRSNLANYKFIFGGNREYFTGIAYNPAHVVYESHTIEEYPSTSMGRNLLIVKVNIGGCEVLLMTSHLESTKDHADERKNQLKMAFTKMKECTPDLNIIFAGDLNLRDKELEELGGLPRGVKDAWIACGKRAECEFTWDMLRNDNTIFNGRFKPRCRFDRIFYKSATTQSSISPTFFGLIGLSRLHPYRTYPSDHWGLLCFFSLNSK